LAPNTLDRIELKPIDPNALGFKTPEIAIEHYKRGAEQFYLWFGNDVFTYDANETVRRFEWLGRAAAQLSAIGLGVHPTFRIAPLAGRAGWEDVLSRTRATLGIAFATFSVAGLAIAYLLLQRFILRGPVESESNHRSPAPTCRRIRSRPRRSRL
jgi:hypothetical protein